MIVKRQTRVNLRFGPAVVLLAIVAASCGSAGSVSSPTNTDTARSEPGEPPDLQQFVPTDVPTHEDFVFDENTDITLFPPEFYDVTPCGTASPVQSEPDPSTDFAPSSISEPADIMDAFDRIIVVEIAEAKPAMTATPVDLPADYAEGIGAAGEYGISFPATPVAVDVVDVIAGPEVDETVLLEIGCFDEGRLPSTTPGQQLLVFAAASDPTLGPDLGDRIDTRVQDWMALDSDGTLQPRVGLFGAPPLAPFLDGMSLDDVVDQLKDETTESAGSGQEPTAPLDLIEPECDDEPPCAEGFELGGAFYGLDCTAIRASSVSSEVLGAGTLTGQQVTAHAIRDIDPAVLVAVSLPGGGACYDGDPSEPSPRWRLAIGEAASENQIRDALCTVADHS